MAIEAGGKNGIFEFDDQTKAAVDARCQLNGTKADYQPVEADAEQKFSYEIDGGFVRFGADGGVPSGSRTAQAGEKFGEHQTGPRVCRLLHRGEDE
jgi:hypothetical protein